MKMATAINTVSKIETLNDRLREVVEKYNSLKESGFDEDILLTYLSAKTKLSRTKVKELLINIDEFYIKLMKKAILSSFEEDKK